MNRGAAVIIAYLMYTFICTLDDAMYYVKAMRSGLLVSDNLLAQLSAYEEDLFGRQLTDIGDLYY